MNKNIFLTGLFVISVLTTLAQPKVQLVTNSAKNKIDILIRGKLFTSYLYSENIKKPVLWPVISHGGNEITRQFPLKNHSGERVDHPHHIGVWLNYGDVNGLDFWNNPQTIQQENKEDYGSIYHETLESAKSGKGKATLLTTASWKDNKGNKLINEISEYTFSVKGKIRIIDRTTLLKAVNGKVSFTDNKEGMFAIRVARALELSSKGKVKITDDIGNIIEIDGSDDKITTGDYLSSNGIEGLEVWGTRANWMKLAGVINGEKVAIVIFDHPGNVGYPTYWHARGYGLFAANNLGQKIFSKGKEELNFSIENGETVTFRYRLAVFSGEPTLDEINKMAKEFESKI